MLIVYLFVLCLAVVRSLHFQNEVASGRKHVSRLQDELFENGFDVPWLANLKMSETPKKTNSPQEAFKVIQQSVNAIMKDMHIPQYKTELPAMFHDTTLDGTRGQAKKYFSNLNIPGTADIIDYSIGKLGAVSVAKADETFDQYSMLAQRMGATSLANQFAPLLRATVEPNPTSMFNLMGSILARSNMPIESLEFVQKLAYMYDAGREPSAEEFHSLLQLTNMRLKNRTQPDYPMSMKQAMPMKRGTDESYHKSFNYLITSFQLPCKMHKKICFVLTVEIHSMKVGPGSFDTGFGDGPREVTNMALGVTTITKHSMINTPFYVWPGKAAGIEFDTDFKGRQFALPYSNQTGIYSSFKMREAPVCVAGGSGYSKDDPRGEFCPYCTFELTGGSPQIWLGLQLFPSRYVRTDSYVYVYQLLNYGGQLFPTQQNSNFVLVPLPDFAFVGFYRDMDPGWWWKYNGKTMPKPGEKPPKPTFPPPLGSPFVIGSPKPPPGWPTPQPWHQPHRPGHQSHHGNHMRSFSVS